MCLDSVFTQATYTQDRLRHVHHMEIVSFRLTANFQPYLSLSVLLERFSVGTSETSCTVRLFHFGFRTPLGTHFDRGSAVNHHQSVLALIATILAQGYVADHVFDREHKFFSRLGIGVFSFDLIHHFVVVGS